MRKMRVVHFKNAPTRKMKMYEDLLTLQLAGFVSMNLVFLRLNYHWKKIHAHVEALDLTQIENMKRRSLQNTLFFSHDEYKGLSFFCKPLKLLTIFLSLQYFLNFVSF